MSWVHDSGYEPAYAHVGYPVAIQIDGSETASRNAPTPLEVIGWRSACECGWRGSQFYPRTEWPSTTALAPDAVDGWENGTATFSEWQCHLDRALPDLAMHDFARQLADIEERLTRACHAARFAGLSWARITRAAGGHPVVHAAQDSEITGRAMTAVHRGALCRPDTERSTLGDDRQPPEDHAGARRNRPAAEASPASLTNGGGPPR